MAKPALTCKHCGMKIERRDLTPEASRWRGGRTVVYIDSVGSAKSTWTDGHYHEPEGEQ